VTHILVIDDNRAVSSALGIMFAHEELDVSIAHDGATGIAVQRELGRCGGLCGGM
jgi:DNA-binding response OmpR family regulator